MPIEIGDEIVNLPRAKLFVDRLLLSLVSAYRSISFLMEGEDQALAVNIADTLEEIREDVYSARMEILIRLALDESRFYEDDSGERW